jgi:hypothetical protein
VLIFVSRCWFNFSSSELVSLLLLFQAGSLAGLLDQIVKKPGNSSRNTLPRLNAAAWRAGSRAQEFFS